MVCHHIASHAFFFQPQLTAPAWVSKKECCSFCLIKFACAYITGEFTVWKKLKVLVDYSTCTRHLDLVYTVNTVFEFSKASVTAIASSSPSNLQTNMFYFLKKKLMWEMFFEKPSFACHIKCNTVQSYSLTKTIKFYPYFDVSVAVMQDRMAQPLITLTLDLSFQHLFI